jgi:hypothetical protein
MDEEESSSSSRIAETASTNVARSQVTDSGAPIPLRGGARINLWALCQGYNLVK